MKNFLRSDKGITGADALLAVALATLFSGIIATLAYNIYATSNSLKRSSQALEYVTSTFEYVANQYYDDITEDSIKEYINTLDANISTQGSNTKYKAQVSVINYNQTEGNEDKLDLVKEITMSVTYKLGNKDQKIEMKTVKAREKLEVPNKPDLDLIEIGEGTYYKYPIKYSNGTWKITTINDAEWYNYDNGMWATVLVSDKEMTVGDIVTELNENIRLWVPRFKYTENSNNGTNYIVNFLYKNTNEQIVNENGKTKIDKGELGETPDNFTNGEIKLTGIWIEKESLQTNPYLYLNNSKYKLDETKYNGKLWQNQ